MALTLLFDVNETLSDLAPMADRFAAVGAPGHLSTLWFAQVLRDGFGLAAAGANVAFAEVAAGVLATLLPEVEAEDRQQLVAGLGELALHEDVAPGLQLLAEQGARLVTLTNGSVDVTEGLLRAGGVREHLDLLLSVQDAPAWKPAAAAYRYALDACQTTATKTLLVAVHPWDIDGAGRAGLRTAWLNRSGGAFPEHLRAPELTVPDLPALAAALRA